MDIERRVHGDLEQSDIIMNRTFFIGVYPGISDEMIDYVIEQLAEAPKMAALTVL